MNKLKVRNYQDIVNDLYDEYEDDLDRLDSAKHQMSAEMYMKFLLQTLQNKAFIEAAPYVGLEESEKPTITFRLQDVDDFIRAIIFMYDEKNNQYMDFKYAIKKSESFIDTLINKLYNFD